ncbi:MAG: hypothetical protein ACREEV_18840 [Dongiaceae bacterium]
MAFRISGPRAREFIHLLAECCGLSLVAVREVDNPGDARDVWSVAFSPNGLINPFESGTLQTLVGDIMRSPNVVEINAFSSAPIAGWFGDWFAANPGVRRPRRTVYVSDLERARDLSPTWVRIGMGHILAEYFGAARPPGQAPGRAFSHFHVPAIRVEAEIASDLTGRRTWEPGDGTARPWEHTYGNINVRSYGPELKYQLVFNGTGNLRNIIEPAGL